MCFLEATFDGLDALGLLSYYYDVSPACACAGPSLTDCDGNPCPEYTMATQANECPLLCNPSEKVYVVSKLGHDEISSWH